jgi:hypothetical protein
VLKEEKRKWSGVKRGEKKMLSSGFTNAPVTKYAIVSLVVSSIAVSLGDVKYLFYIQVVPHLWRYMQVWRLVGWQVSLRLPSLPSSCGRIGMLGRIVFG